MPAAQLRTDPLVIFHSPDPDFPLPPGPFIAAGYDHTCAITASGPTLCWGLNENGQLGDGTDAAIGHVTRSSSPAATRSRRVTAGLRHTCALDTHGAAWCWGDNTYGELGDGTNTSSSTPVAVAGGLRFAYLKAGELLHLRGHRPRASPTAGATTSTASWATARRRVEPVPVKVAFQPWAKTEI